MEQVAGGLAAQRHSQSSLIKSGSVIAELGHLPEEGKEEALRTVEYSKQTALLEPGLKTNGYRWGEKNGQICLFYPPSCDDLLSLALVEKLTSLEIIWIKKAGKLLLLHIFWTKRQVKGLSFTLPEGSFHITLK